LYFISDKNYILSHFVCESNNFLEDLHSLKGRLSQPVQGIPMQSEVLGRANFSIVSGQAITAHKKTPQ
jgi:hypothetical protein